MQRCVNWIKKLESCWYERLPWNYQVHEYMADLGIHWEHMILLHLLLNVWEIVVVTKSFVWREKKKAICDKQKYKDLRKTN